MKKKSYNLGWNWEPNCTIFYSKLERKYRFKAKLHDYWTNLHKN